MPARLHGTNISNTVIKGHQHEDGYVLIDGYVNFGTLDGYVIDGYQGHIGDYNLPVFHDGYYDGYYGQVGYLVNGSYVNGPFVGGTLTGYQGYTGPYDLPNFVGDYIATSSSFGSYFVSTYILSLPRDSVFSSFTRTGVGLWTATLKEAYPCNLNYFRVLPQLFVGSSPSVLVFQLLSDNVGVHGTNPGDQKINFMFCNGAGTPTDLPLGAGFKYKIGLRLSTADYYTETY